MGARGVVVAVTAALVVGLGAGPVQARPTAAHGPDVVRSSKARIPKPVVKRVKPAQGPAAGGTTVKIKGKNFVKVKKVVIGGTKARIVKVKNPRKIIVVAPKHAPGTFPVRVKTKAGKSKLSRKARFTYVGAAPVVSTLTPSSGPAAGGTTVEIKGANLTGATAVSFGGTAASSFTVESATLVKAVSPAHAAGAVSVTVTTPSGTSPGVTYTYEAPSGSPPVVVLVTPATGTVTGGTAVTISGTGFTGATAVSFGGTAATSYTVDSDSSISATTPAHAAGPVAVSVTTPSGTSTVPGLFVYNPLPANPVVVLVTPATGPLTGGTAVTITGTGFTGATAVSFGGTAATTFTVDSDTSISATTPAHAVGPVDVSVTTPVGTSTVPGLFVYNPLPPTPLVILVTPALGLSAGGTAVTITGTGFTGATAVSFGGTAAATFTVDSDLSISATTPAHASGPVTVSVTTPGGTSTVPGLFVYL